MKTTILAVALLALCILTSLPTTACADLWRVKFPGASSVTVTWRDGLRPDVWDAAGNAVALATTTVDGPVSLLGVGETADSATHDGPAACTIDGDAFWVDLPAGTTPRQTIADSSTGHDGDPFWGRLAAHWAPVWYQDEDDSCAWADWITAVDFDGDFVGTNNWNNAGKREHAFHGSLLNEAVVYWWVVETDTHWYLGFADFHPRDWNDRDSMVNKFMGLRAALTSYDDQHENDMEGALLVLRKHPDHPYGLPELMQTQAHNDFWQYSPLGEALRGREGRENVDGPIVEADDGRPCLFVESKGHGVYGSAEKTDYDGRGRADGRVYYYAGDGDDDMLCWPVEAGDDEQLVPTGTDAPAFLRQAADGRGRRPVDYALRSMTTLWNRRGGEPFVDVPGGRPSFHGTVHGDDAANPPWAWIDSDYAGKGLVDGGPVFFSEPAHFYSWQFDAAAVGPVALTVTGASCPGR